MSRASQSKRNALSPHPVSRVSFHLKKTWPVILKGRRNFESCGAHPTRQRVNTVGGFALQFVSDRHDVAHDNHPPRRVAGSSAYVVVYSGTRGRDSYGLCTLDTGIRVTSRCRVRGSRPSPSGVPYLLPKLDAINRIPDTSLMKLCADAGQNGCWLP